MKILTNLETLGLEIDDLPGLPIRTQETADAFVKDILGCILEDATGGYGYFYPISSPSKQIVFGREKPEQIRAAGESWNKEIRAYFLACLKALRSDNAKPDDVIELDTEATYNMQVAAHMLNNDWTEDCIYGVVLDACVFNVTLTPAQMEDIALNPDQYILLDVAVKT